VIGRFWLVFMFGPPGGFWDFAPTSRTFCRPRLCSPFRHCEKTGWLYDVGNAEQLARGIITLLNDELHRATHGTNARELSRRLFDVRQMLTGSKPFTSIISRAKRVQGREAHRSYRIADPAGCCIRIIE
jgi:hypothetical protein